MSESTNEPGVPDVEEQVNQMASHLLSRNMRAVKDAVQSQANELAHLRGQLVEIQQSVSSVLQVVNEMKQLQLVGLAANRGTGPTS